VERRRRRLRGWHVVVTQQAGIQGTGHPIRRIAYLCLILLLAAAIGVYVSARIRWSRRIDRQFAAMKAARLPTTLAELNRWYRLPDGVIENAADTYLDAFACYVEPNEEDANKVPASSTSDLPGRTESLPGQTQEAMARFVAGNKRALTLLHEAADIPACRYPIDFRKGQAAQVPWQNLVKSVYLLCCDAILLAEHGQSASAGRSIESAARVQDSLLAEPLVLSQSTRMYLIPTILSSLERVMTRGALPPEVLLGVDRALARADDPNAMRRAMVGECLLGIDLIQHTPTCGLSPSDEGWNPGPIGLWIYRAVGLGDRDEAEYMEGVTAVVEALALPERQRLSAVVALERDQQKVPSSNHVLLDLVRPRGSAYCLFELSALAQIRAAGTALAVERYRLKTVSLPASLEGLGPEYLAAVPLDPFTGDPLKYRQLAKGYVVYSVGQDLSDDGGKERPPKGEADLYDVTFIVER
jgi:hypothetical protein